MKSWVVGWSDWALAAFIERRELEECRIGRRGGAIRILPLDKGHVTNGN